MKLNSPSDLLGPIVTLSSGCHDLFTVIENSPNVSTLASMEAHDLQRL